MHRAIVGLFFKNSPFEIIPKALNQWKSFIQNHALNLNYEHVIFNNDIELRKAFDAFSNPLFFLIDKEGILLAKKISPNTLKKELLQSFKNFKR